MNVSFRFVFNVSVGFCWVFVVVFFIYNIVVFISLIGFKMNLKFKIDRPKLIYSHNLLIFI